MEIETGRTHNVLVIDNVYYTDSSTEDNVEKAICFLTGYKAALLAAKEENRPPPVVAPAPVFEQNPLRTLQEDTLQGDTL